MSPSMPATCPHERRPGTTVCLRCRHEARLAGRARAFNLALRAGAIALGLATLGAVGTAGARALQSRLTPVRQGALLGAVPADTLSEIEGEAPPSLSPPSDSATGAVAQPSGVPDPPAAGVAPAAAAASTRTASLPSPIVDQGRTDLGDGLFAVRDGTSVTVHFDVARARTRRRDKFDRIVRATLPRVFGSAAQSLLDRIPPGQLVASGTLPADLQSTGLRLDLTDGSILALWPETRPASGGPLVVAYRAEVAP